MTARLPSISALILAGGRGQRMAGSDKGLVELHHRPLISHVIERLAPQLELIRISANRNQGTYAELAKTCLKGAGEVAVIEDDRSDYQGPLAGIARGLFDCPTEWLLVVPCDTPQLPGDLVTRLYQQAVSEQADIAVAHDGERLQPVVSLIRRSLHPSLERFLDGGDRKIDRWYRQQAMCEVDFSDQAEAFCNINTPQDKAQLEKSVS